MAYRKKTLRQLNPTARKLGKAIGELQSTTNKLKNIIEDVNLQEAEVLRLTKVVDYLTNDATVLLKAKAI
ncbi:MAG: hypothetical protein Q8K02_17690 [Flavobacterium sp.]|nr:hypothetical protein [Flavobacterium sp.]